MTAAPVLTPELAPAPEATRERLDMTEFAFDTVCDLGWWDKPCPNPARWILRRSCCGTYALACHDCKDERVESDAQYTCAVCSVEHVVGRYAYLSIEPLNQS